MHKKKKAVLFEGARRFKERGIQHNYSTNAIF